MGKPTREQLAQALSEAARMREAGEDPNYLAKTLLNHNYRLKQLERVLKQLELYLHSGEDVTEHARLLRAIEHYHDNDDGSDEHPDSFGLE